MTMQGGLQQLRQPRHRRSNIVVAKSEYPSINVDEPRPKAMHHVRIGE
ncbi:hypothetical protein [Mesorhizobium sp. L-8-10]|nr:hypothetical protein [Mesorhizobium sp. L-8-10]